MGRTNERTKVMEHTNERFHSRVRDGIIDRSAREKKIPPSEIFKAMYLYTWYATNARSRRRSDRKKKESNARKKKKKSKSKTHLIDLESELSRGRQHDSEKPLRVFQQGLEDGDGERPGFS